MVQVLMKQLSMMRQEMNAAQTEMSKRLERTQTREQGDRLADWITHLTGQALPATQPSPTQPSPTSRIGSSSALPPNGGTPVHSAQEAPNAPMLTSAERSAALPSAASHVVRVRKKSARSSSSRNLAESSDPLASAANWTEREVSRAAGDADTDAV